MSPDNPYERGHNDPTRDVPSRGESGDRDFGDDHGDNHFGDDRGDHGDRTATMGTHPQRNRNKGGAGDIHISTGDVSAYINIELIVYLLATIGMFIASIVVDQLDDGTGFGADKAWFYFVLLTVGYLISRGLAKSGSGRR